MKKILSDADFRKHIEDYYLPRRLVEAIEEHGAIPEGMAEALVGIGFADIANYTWLAKFLSPSENQAVLDGIFTAFNLVLTKRGAFLNKIEGDSIMFHFGGPIDSRIMALKPEARRQTIAENLFHTCVELQRVAILFNEANDSFLKVAKDRETVEAMRKAYEIMKSLRTNVFISQSINALYQIRVRVGCTMGDVTMGNFGPKGRRQWDVIGVPVIAAKRMETSAPIGGLRITKELYDILHSSGVAENYHRLFRKDAHGHQGRYRDIQMEEIFRFRHVQLKQKEGAQFESYSVQVDPLLPERIARQAKLLLEKGEDGIERIISLFEYYRGNRYVIEELEDLFRKKEISVNKSGLLKLLDARRFRSIMAETQDDPVRCAARIDREYDIYKLLKRLGDIQDVVKHEPRIIPRNLSFSDQNQYLAAIQSGARKAYTLKSAFIRRRSWFYNFLYPMTFTYLRSAMMEYQGRSGEMESEGGPAEQPR